MSEITSKAWFMQLHYFDVFVLTLIGFALTYFVLACLTLLMTQKILPFYSIGHIIDCRPVSNDQKKREVIQSLISIVVFACYAVLTVILVQSGTLTLHWQSPVSIIIMDLMVLTFWNEWHFYCCHRLLHTKWLYKKVHIHHHRSVTPTPFSTFSFHWFEAVLLSSVMVTLMPFCTLSIEAVYLFPVVSLLINNVGHMNYAIFTKKSPQHLLSSCLRHTAHHNKFRKNYGFFLTWPDKLFKSDIR